VTPRLIVADLLPGFKPIQKAGINPTYHGAAWWEDGNKSPRRGRVYFKAIPPEEIFVECLCALLGQSFGLPVQQPVLLCPEPDCCPPGHDPNVPLFGTLDDGHVSFLQFIDKAETMDRSSMNAILEERLQRWKHLPRAALFDEQIANNDRHMGNLLFGGGNDFRLIDHGLAFRGIAKPNERIPLNQLMMFIQNASQKYLEKAEKSLSSKDLKELGSIDLGPLIDMTLHQAYLNGNDTCPKSVLDFYRERINHITSIILSYFHPQSGSLF